MLLRGIARRRRRRPHAAAGRRAGAGGATRGLLALLFLTLALSAGGGVALAADDHLRDRATTGDFGGIGLMQTRTARFAQDGQFSFGGGISDPYDRVFLTWQILPWLEGTFRYTSDEQLGDRGLDRGADFKFLLLEETRDQPALAIGVQDFLGTGRFDSEYIVASKRVYDFDFSFGLVWGYSVGSKGLFRNPLTYLSDSFSQRTRPGGSGGELRLGTFFSGPRMDLFGGVEYHTPIEGLSLKAEYDPNDYRDEIGGPLDQTLPINFGLVYRPFSWLEAAIALERGNTLMARFAFRTDLNADGVPKFSDPKPPPLHVRPRVAGGAPGAEALARGVVVAEPVTPAALTASLDLDALEAAMQRQGLRFEGLTVAGERATIAVSVQSLALIESKLRALAPLAVASVPAEVSSFEFAVETSDGERRGFVYDRRQMTEAWLVDALFDRLEAQDFAVDSFIVSQGHTIVRARINRPRNEIDFLVAARAIRDLSPLPAHTVTVLGVEDGEATSSLVLDVADSSHLYTPRLDKVATAAPEGDRPTPLTAAETKALAEKIFAELPPHGLVGEAFHLTYRTATLAVTPTRYPEVARNIGRTARILSGNLPASVEELAIVLRVAGVDLSRVTLLRRHLEDLALGRGSPEEVLHSAQVERPVAAFPEGTVENEGLYPKFSWSFGPSLRQSVGAPEDPYLFQIWARLSASLELRPGLSLHATVGKDLYNNFDRITRGPKGELHPVRSNIKEYLQQGEDNLARLQANYLFSPAPNWYGRASVGIFEEMFAGIGGEVLYRRQRARWAVALELNHVWQRGFEQRFGFQDYDVTTGHLKLYYKLPFYDLETSIQAGRYLAGDWGATFQLARTFDSGIKVGGFFTLTNVSADEFGEGSFDKGFFMTIPLGLLTPFSTRESWGVLFRPLTSDGGQMVNVGPKLYDLTEEGQLHLLDRDWHSLLQ